jgi:hypothetical protein
VGTDIDHETGFGLHGDQGFVDDADNLVTASAQAHAQNIGLLRYALKDCRPSSTSVVVSPT